MKKDYNVNNGFVRKYELAFEYFPNSPSKKAATRNLVRAIDRCSPLKRAMEESKSGTTSTTNTSRPSRCASFSTISVSRERLERCCRGLFGSQRLTKAHKGSQRLTKAHEGVIGTCRM